MRENVQVDVDRMSTTTNTLSFSTPKKQNPNPHPYAIKTTSTALLSRNSSSSSTLSTAHHYIPASSPSPSSPTQTGFEKYRGERRYSRHRYSRSLTSELPRPLPAPPSAAAAAAAFGGLNDDDTPRRRVQRTYSLPQEMELSEDPKRWTPTEVSMYLTSTLNAGSGGHDLPASVARDIADFVRDKKITGKSFLRLNEVDLEEYGINQLWRTTLVNASRSLRRNILHGRIWGNHTELDDNDNDDDDKLSSTSSLSSNSNFVITNRQRSLSNTSETRGRVRDMIDTLERSSSASSSELDEEGSCTVSSDARKNKDTNCKRDNVRHNKHRSLEQQQQQQGRLPQRGSVSNLFGTSGPGPNTQSEREVGDKDVTITAHARKNVNGNEPRLLPFPPTGASNPNHHSHGYAHILTPSHTGSSYPLPPSPDHIQNQQTTPYYLDPNHILNNQPLQYQHHHQQPYLFPSHPHSQPNHTPSTFDYYELGFKNTPPMSSPSPLGGPLGPLGPPIRSPNSQRYVVQHNPNTNVQSSTTGNSTTATGSTGRLLPYPPIVGEAELFHPRPRMGLGVGGMAGGLEDGLDRDADGNKNGNGDVEVEAGGEGGGDESVYYSASETQTEFVDSDSGRGRDNGEERSAARSGMKGPGTTGYGNEIEIGFGTEGEGEGEGEGEAIGKQDEVKVPEKAEEEPSIQDLLLAQPQAHPHTISGVEAWEMELGETVKRISTGAGGGGGGGGDTSSSIMGIGSKTRTRPKKREMIMGEIGRKSGRAGTGVGLEGGRKKITSVLGPELFEAPDQVGSSAGDAGDAGDAGSVDHKGLETGSVPLPDFSTSSASTSTFVLRDSSLDEPESTIVGPESSLDIPEPSIAERESVVAERESIIAARESSIAEQESTIAAREFAIMADQSQVQQRLIDVQKRELDVDKRESEVWKREQEISEREVKVERREEEAKEWYEGKLVEIDKVLGVPADGLLISASTPTPTSTSTSETTAKFKWPASPVEFARRLCATFLLPVLGKERTPRFLLHGNGEYASSSNSSSTTTDTSSTPSISNPAASPPTPPATTPPPLIPSWSFKRDFFLNRVLGGKGGYLVLMSIGICVVFLRGVVRRILGVGAGRSDDHDYDNGDDYYHDDDNDDDLAMT